MITYVKKAVIAIIIVSAAPVAQAYVEPYLMDVSYAQVLNCSGGNGVWRSDELYQNTREVDPYIYGAHETWSMPVYNQPTYTSAQVYRNVSAYENSGSMDTYTTAAQNLAAATAHASYDQRMYQPQNTVTRAPTVVAAPVVRKTLASQQQYTNTVSEMGVPSCRLTPTYSGDDTIVLSWSTLNASTVFIDNGIGHVQPFSGKRVVTPNTSTTYTMTVVSDSGSTAQCIAKILMEGSSSNTTGTTVTDASTVETSTDPVGATVDAVTAKTSEVSSNIFSKILGGVETGQTVWDRIRSVSLVAIALIIILGVIVFIMKRIFGGGGEGGH